MQIREIEITHQLGLHARACARVVTLASRFRCNVALAMIRLLTQGLAAPA